MDWIIQTGTDGDGNAITTTLNCQINVTWAYQQHETIDYEDLTNEDQSLRGFFTEKAGVIFNRIIPKSSFSILPHEDKSDADEPDEDELQRMYEDVFG